jgi:serine/threonine protein kinase/Tol biopolymer transport system component
MTPQRWRHIEELYHMARERGAAVLSDADADLRRAVEKLLAQDPGGKLLDGKAAELFPEPENVTVGSQVGPYRVEGILGSGGMGVVYSAQDTRLKRRVALKVLPSAFIHDPERSARFQREAEVLAQLNHPNIAHIFGAEESALAMEFVEGESPKGPMPFDEAWKIALQTADALEYAHERGVIHRDLKPANMKVTPDGVVKLLDFGLAKAFSETSGTSLPDTGSSPVQLPVETAAGVILGTAAYMSPEQAKGKRLDRRTDIWSWGVVFYELLTGEQLFRAETISETIAQVLTKEPEFDRIPAKARKLLQSCLEKDPKKRLRDIGDVSQLLDEPTVPRSGVPSRSILSWAPIAVALAVTAAFGVMWFTRTPQSGPTLRYDIALENATNIHSFAISPDGRYLAMAAEVNGKRQLWLRALDALRAQPMLNTDDATFPFWSADSREIGFFAQGELKRIASTGGPVISICDALDGRNGSWSRENVILFSRYAATSGATIQRVSASGGVPIDVIKGGDLSRDPAFLPDGRRFLYNVDAAQHRGIYLTELDRKERRRILAEDSSFVLTPGWILFVRANRLMAQPFDADAGRVTGDAIPVVDGVSLSNVTGYASIAASASGVLVYEGGRANVGKTQMAWHDRSGNLLGSVGNPDTVFDPAISPDQKKIVFRWVTSSFLADLWLWDVNRGTGQRITTHPSVNGSPHWSPGGDRIAFTSNRGNGDLYIRAAGGTGEDQLLLANAHPKFVSDWSRDGRSIVYSEADPKTRYDLWVLPIDHVRAGNPIRFLGSEFNEVLGQLSPDVHWMAYTSDESGQREVYVRPFPSGDGQWKVSIGGGEQSRWRADGRELYFVRADGAMMAAPVKAVPGPNPVFEPGTPRPLFHTHLVQTVRSGNFEYDVTPDGKRFLLDSTVEGSTSALPLTVVVNWAAGLKR